MSQQFDGVNEVFLELLKTVASLRDPLQGCPWDKEQTSKTLLPYLLEEAQEFIATVEKDEESSMAEELGDVLFQVVLHSQIAYEKKLFSINELCQKLNAKLIERHPHVFNKSSPAMNAEEVKKQWNQNKVDKGGLQKLNDAMKLPPLLASQKIGNFSNGVGFDWENAEQVLLKVDEELAEVKEAVSDKKSTLSKDSIAEEIGDLIFSTVQLARHLDLSADYCLNLANHKFQQRFMDLHQQVTKDKKDLLTMPLEEKEFYWSKAKKNIKSKKL